MTHQQPIDSLEVNYFTGKSSHKIGNNEQKNAQRLMENVLKKLKRVLHVHVIPALRHKKWHTQKSTV